MITRPTPQTATLVLATALFFSATSVLGSEHDTRDKTTLEDIQRELAETGREIKDYSIERRDEAAAKAKKSLDELDAHIERLEERLEAQWDEMSQEARQNAKDTLKALKKKRREAAEWYGGLLHSSKEAWEDVKQGFLDSYSTLMKQFDKAADRFSEGPENES